jgi:hypothetical protein
VAAGTSSHRANPVGINAEPVGIRTQIPHRGFDVFYGGRELMSRRKTITDGSGDVPPFGQLDRHRQVALPRASTKSPTVDQYDSGPLLRRRGSWPNDIHRNALADVRVFQVRFVYDCCGY